MKFFTALNTMYERASDYKHRHIDPRFEIPACITGPLYVVAGVAVGITYLGASFLLESKYSPLLRRPKPGNVFDNEIIPIFSETAAAKKYTDRAHSIAQAAAAKVGDVKHRVEDAVHTVKNVPAAAAQKVTDAVATGARTLEKIVEKNTA